MVCIAQNIHHPQRFLRCKTRNTTHREAVLRDWQRDPVDAGPMWQPELHLLFTVVFKAEKSILRWLLKTEQSVEQVSLCIRYIISPKNPHIFHSEMMEDSTNLCYSFFFFLYLLPYRSDTVHHLRQWSNKISVLSHGKEKGAWQLTLSACWPCIRAICWGDSATLPSTDRLVGFMLWAAAGKSTVT